MKSFRIAFLVVVCAMSSYKAMSQSPYYYYDDRYFNNALTFEFTAGLGTMNCITDVGGANSDSKYYLNEMRSKNYKLSFNVALQCMYENFVGLRLQGTWGTVSARDADISSEASGNLISKRYRNLNFKSNITEVALLAEFHPLMLLNYEETPPLFSPYILGGIGFFSFNPQAEVGGRMINLSQLHTEGQGFPEYRDRNPYRLAQANVPIGIGFRYEVSPLWNVKVEYLHRILFTDYLDDASNRKYIDPELFSKYLVPEQAAYAKALADPRIPVPEQILQRFKNPIGGFQPARRGNPDDNDSYMTLSIKIGLTIGRQERP